MMRRWCRPQLLATRTDRLRRRSWSKGESKPSIVLSGLLRRRRPPRCRRQTRTNERGSPRRPPSRHRAIPMSRWPLVGPDTTSHPLHRPDRWHRRHRHRPDPHPRLNRHRRPPRFARPRLRAAASPNGNTVVGSAAMTSAPKTTPKITRKQATMTELTNDERLRKLAARRVERRPQSIAAPIGRALPPPTTGALPPPVLDGLPREPMVGYHSLPPRPDAPRIVIQEALSGRKRTRKRVHAPASRVATAGVTTAGFLAMYTAMSTAAPAFVSTATPDATASESVAVPTSITTSPSTIVEVETVHRTIYVDENGNEIPAPVTLPIVPPAEETVASESAEAAEPDAVAEPAAEESAQAATAPAATPRATSAPPKNAPATPPPVTAAPSPVTAPPATQPPATQPPATQPPATTSAPKPTAPPPPKCSGSQC